jgi:hypothetical protein
MFTREFGDDNGDHIIRIECLDFECYIDVIEPDRSTK